MSGPDVVTPPGEPPEEHLRAVRERLVAAARTLRAASVGPRMFVQHYRHSAAQTPGWILKRASKVESSARPGVLRLTQLTLAAATDPTRLLKLDVYETASADAAQLLLVELLAGFQSLPALIPLRQEIGEADAILPGDTAGIFIRGNLVVMLANAGTSITPVSALAHAIDQFLVAQPAETAAGAANAATAAPDAMLKFVTTGAGLRQQDDGSVSADSAEQPAVYAFDARNETWRTLAQPAEPGGKPPRSRPRRTKR